ncbi:hypothetical protein KDW_16220 [Dictyobacter vulcani]|uniref:Uncharacterized protein n=1 Tax=Dictyobacter vulcani TaxID=2607529 RepID=A0A5J4KM45_9CHLR|nr:hypothetical protein [Dictyobacter vulcani]GER87460.1 hypothetical protein KDW_16220 [Dictyobacter vulcani]
MDTTPQKLPDTASEEGQSQSSPRSLADVMSWGEQLLPLTYSALEACWIAVLLIGLGRLHFLGLKQPFMPLWGLFWLCQWQHGAQFA